MRQMVTITIGDPDPIKVWKPSDASLADRLFVSVGDGHEACITANRAKLRELAQAILDYEERA